jgi:hypothetical protein
LVVDLVAFDDVCVSDDADARHGFLIVHPSASGLVDLAEGDL